MTKWKGWKAVIRDVIIIWILTGIGGLLIGIATAGSELPMAAIGISNIILGIVGFCISGCMTEENRWKHLCIVAIFVWLTSIINILIGPFALKNWMFTIFIIFIMMVIGGGISFLIKKTTNNASINSQQS
jgi:hypothetical protein